MQKAMKRCGIVFISICVFIALLLTWHSKSINFTRVLTTKVNNQIITPEQIRVATYNVKGLNGGTSLDEFEKDIQAIKPDIICLQEVDKKSFRSNNMDMAKEMAAVGDYPYYYFFQSLWLVDGYYGTAILSKYPILEVTSKQMPTALFEEPRMLTRAIISLGEKEIEVFNTHLSFRNREDRKKQIAFIKHNVVSENSILMGDFNTFHVDEFFTLPNMAALNDEQYQFITFRDFGFPDNIFYASNFTLLAAEALSTTFSDHNLLYCDLLIKNSS